MPFVTKGRKGKLLCHIVGTNIFFFFNNKKKGFWLKFQNPQVSLVCGYLSVSCLCSVVVLVASGILSFFLLFVVPIELRSALYIINPPKCWDLGFQVPISSTIISRNIE